MVNTLMLDSLLRKQEEWLERQKQLSREKVKKGKPATKSFSLRRQDELLRAPDDYDREWAFCVPSYFNDALDIRRAERVKAKGETVAHYALEWTQGSMFHFSGGDTLYDTPNKAWSEQMQELSLCLQIEKASPVNVSGEGDAAYRFPGSIECAVFTPDENRQRLVKRGTVTMTQDEFVRVLIVGPNETISVLLNKR